LPKLELKFQPKQYEASEYVDNIDRGLYLFYGGAKGGGKSFLGRAKLIQWCMQFSGISAVIVRKTYPELLANHIRKLFQEYPFIKEWYRAAEKTVYFPNGSTLELNHLAVTADVYNYQGIEYDIIFLDEATQHEEEVFKILKTSLRSDPKIRNKYPNFKPFFLLTGNPGGIGHSWVKRLFVDKDYLPNESKEDYHFIQAKIYDNFIFLEANPEYLRNLQDLPEELQRAYLDGDWTVFVGQFFNDYRRQVHGIKPFEIDKEWVKIFSLDWGYAPHPFHCGWYAINENVIVKYRELEGREMSPIEVADQIIELSVEDGSLYYGVGDTQMWEQNPFQSAYEASQGEIYSDKSIALQINDVLAKAGMTMMKANKARITGWTNLKTLMKWKGEYTDTGVKITEPPCYRVFENCVKTLVAYPSQIYDNLKPGDMKKQDGDDPCDSDRYAIMAIWDKYSFDVRSYFVEEHAISKEKDIFDKALKKEYPGLIFAEEEPEENVLYG
jgi:phage terminase large subunit